MEERGLKEGIGATATSRNRRRLTPEEDYVEEDTKVEESNFVFGMLTMLPRFFYFYKL